MKVYTMHSSTFLMIRKSIFYHEKLKNKIFLLLLFFTRPFSWLYFIFFKNLKHLSLFILCYKESRNSTCIHAYIFIFILIYIICNFYLLISIHIGHIKLECSSIFSAFRIIALNKINFALMWSDSFMNETCFYLC